LRNCINVVYFLHMKIKMAPSQVQKPILAPAMKQSIEVLLLPLLDLSIAVDQELQENPMLEIDENRPQSDAEADYEQMLKRIEKNLSSRYSAYDTHFTDDEVLEEKPLCAQTCLEDTLLRQMRIEFSDPIEIKIGELIIGNLDEDGYLNTTCEEIAELAKTEDISQVERTLKKIQLFEPLGIASRSLKECLLAQVIFRCNGNADLVYQIIEGYLESLARKRFTDIARKLHVNLEDVKEAATTIGTFEPKPARNFRPLKSNLYVTPDIFITTDENDEFKIHINNEGIPRLRVNPVYKKYLKNPSLTADDKLFIREKIKNAMHFIRSIEQRGNTVRKITEYIIKNQIDFFRGDSNNLNPMTMKEVAQAIDRNESTISRAVNIKYIDTPKGIFPLKFFFSQGISNSGSSSGSTASRSVKEEIKELIETEDKSSPLSDQSIQLHFEKKGMKIARRTISKYRLNLKILPSHLRKA